VRIGPPNTGYPIDGIEELGGIIDGFIADEMVFVVTTAGGTWVETTLERSEEAHTVSAREGQTIDVFSWSGQNDRTVAG
jgi:hypothetical protein